jgi:cleavage and polyadenylation specificity factor subunit 1
MGGVIILGSNSIIYVDQAARRVILPVNAWHARVSDAPVQQLTPDEQARKLELDGCRAVFVDERTILLFLLDGAVYPVELITDGKSVSKLSMSPALARTAVPTLVESIAPGLLFVGSSVGPSVLLTAARVEEKVAEQLATLSTSVSTIKDADTIMDLGDDDGQLICLHIHSILKLSFSDIYGGTKSIPEFKSVARSSISKMTRTVIHLSLSDSLPGHGSIADMAFSLARNGVLILLHLFSFV